MTIVLPGNTGRSAEDETAPWWSRFGWLSIWAIAVTAGFAAAIWIYSRALPGREFASSTYEFMRFVGLVHFAVGYHFFFRAPSTRRAARQHRGRFITGLTASALLGVAIWWTHPASNPFLYTVFYLHAAENGVFHLFKMQRPGPGGREFVSLPALFPMLLLLCAARAIVGPAWAGAGTPGALLQYATIALYIAFLRRFLPRTAWGAGGGLLRQQWVMALGFLVVAVGFRNETTLAHCFIIWHCVVWSLYSWIQYPESRSRLLWSHMLFGSAYGALWVAYLIGIPLGHPAVIPLLIGPASFAGQTVCHILLSSVFRSYRPAVASTASYEQAPIRSRLVKPLGVGAVRHT